MGAKPSERTEAWKSNDAWWKIDGRAVKWLPMAQKMRMTWVTMKKRKMGARIVTDSLTPRRLRTMRRTRTTISAPSLAAAQWAGRKDHRASQPEATEVEMVRT